MVAVRTVPRAPRRSTQGGSPPVRLSIRGRAGPRGTAGRSCPRTAPRTSDAIGISRPSRRRRAERGLHRVCAFREPAHVVRCRPSGGPWRARRPAGGSATGPTRRRDDIADAGEPANVNGFAPVASPSRIISASPRVISPALPLSPHPRSSTAPAAIATMFLSAPHNSTPTMSSLTYTRNARLPTPDRPLRELLVIGPDNRRRRHPVSDLEGEVRARQRSDAPTDRAHRLGDNLAHPQKRSRLEPFGHREEVGRRRHRRRDALHLGPKMRGRDGEQDEVGGGRQGRRLSGRDQGRRQVDARQAGLVATSRAVRLPPWPPNAR